MDPEIAVMIRRDALFSATEAGCHDGAADRSAGETPPDVAQLRENGIVGPSVGLRLPEHSADQKHLGSRPVAPIRLQNHAAPALRCPYWPRHDAQDSRKCAFPVFDELGHDHDWATPLSGISSIRTRMSVGGSSSPDRDRIGWLRSDQVLG